MEKLISNQIKIAFFPADNAIFGQQVFLSNF